MVAIGARVPGLSCSLCQRRRLTVALLTALTTGLLSCASTQELYAEYDEQFCPADGQEVALSAILTDEVATPEVVERVVIKEVPAAGIVMLEWEPAVYFKSNSTALSLSAKRSLDGNLKILQKFPRHLVAIRGFTDVHSSQEYNRELAQKRIAGVKRYLTKQGVAGVRVVGTSHGESVPLAGDDSAIADNINRRVELLLLDRNGRPVTSRQPVVMGPAES